jgi:predicted phosphodiesterase
MRALLISDIHSNLQAFEAVLAAAPQYDVVWNLGDIVGYGANPNEVVDLARNLSGIVVRGNHDRLCSGNMKFGEYLNYNRLALFAAGWTQDVLAKENVKWLSKLRRGPLRPLGPQVLCVHGAPKYEDRYIRYESDARFALKASRARITFFGHTHLQGCWFSQGRDLTGVKPDFPSTNGTVRFEVALHKIHRYLMNPGSVGQPRDGDWRAAFAVFDDAEPMLTLFRVPYDVAIAQQRILWAGLPDALATRLQQGR